MLNAAIIGFGGIAKAVHEPAYKQLEKQGKARLVAACDIDEKQFAAKAEINIASSSGASYTGINFYTDLEKMLASEQVDLIDICLPTPLHAPTAVDMLQRGYHVISEKPMARTYEQCRKMIDAANATGKKLMIGQCLRFFPDYCFLKSIVESGEYGRPVSAVFRRQSGPPLWSFENWYLDREKWGGCIFDMHIHDIDMARWLFGEPDAISCVTADAYSGDDIVHSRLFYESLAVFAVGDWSQFGTGFAADFRVGFEKATVVGENSAVTVYPRSGETFKPELSEESGYTREIEFFVNSIINDTPNTANAPESAAATVKLIESLKQSALADGVKMPYNA